ncbi:MAG TPA: histone-like nucleoid-structuring protein Lsr2 [Mycobacteriales bacterium]
MTIDSAEPLEHVLLVVGSMYGVTLALAADDKQVAVAKPAKSPARRSSAAGRTRRRTRTSAPTTADIRAWAKSNGSHLKDRGRIPAAVVTAYKSAHR